MLVQDIIADIMDRTCALSQSQAAQLQLKPTKAFKQFNALCKDKACIKIILECLRPLWSGNRTLAYWLSMLLVVGVGFPKLLKVLVEFQLTEALTSSLQELSSFVSLAQNS